MNFKTLILGCLDEFIADVLTDIALDHIIHIYVIMIMIHVMRFVRTWSLTQKTGLLMTRHISTKVSSRFAHVSLHWQRLYNKYHTCRDIVSFT